MLSFLPKPFWFSWLFIAVILLYILMLVFSFDIPILWDDVWYPLVSARAGYDGWASLGPFPQCQSFVTPIPYTLLPGRYLSWLVHASTDNLYSMRLTNIFIILTWIGYTAWFLKRCVIPDIHPIYIIGIIISLAGLGILPFSMLMNRPEAAMILAITFFTSLPLLMKKYNISLKNTIFTSILFLLVTSWFISSHPKALLYMPLILLAAIWFCAWNKIIGSIVTTVTIYIFYQAWEGFWKIKLTCQGSQEAARNFESQTLLLLNDYRHFWTQLKNNIFSFNEYIRGSVFFEPMILPTTALNKLDAYVLPIVTSIIYFLLLWVSVNVIILLRNMWKNQLKWKDPALLISSCLMFSALAQIAIQSQKKFYNFSLIWISLLLGGIIVQMLIIDWKQNRRTKLCLILCCVTICLSYIASQVATLYIYRPAFIQMIEKASPNGVIHPFFHTMSPQYYTINQPNILKLAENCDISLNSSSRHLVIDTYTYNTLKRTYQPLNIEFRYNEFNQPENFFAFIENWESSGLLTLCQSLPQKIRRLTIQHNRVCCMSRKQMDQFSRP